jgi:O-antigen ligase
VTFRLLVWRNAVARIERSPWFGIGFGSEAILFPAWNCDTMPSATSNCGAAHNTYLMLAMRLGVPLALLLCATLGWTLVRAAVSVLSGPDSAERSTTFVAALLLLSFLVFGTTGLLFESPYLSSIVWVLAGIVAERTRPEAGGGVRAFS